MTLPSKVYDVLKFLVKFIPLLVAFCGSVMAALGVCEGITNTVLIVLGAIGTLIEGLIQICKANYYKNEQTEDITE